MKGGYFINKETGKEVYVEDEVSVEFGAHSGYAKTGSLFVLYYYLSDLKMDMPTYYTTPRNIFTNKFKLNNHDKETI